MVYDCFIFNDELDLLLLRLEFLSPVVDKFVLIESEFSFSGDIKPLHYNINKQKFHKFNEKIIYDHVQLKDYIKDNAWENEYFQRNFIKTKLLGLNDGDIVHISDVDEIPNLYSIFKHFSIDKPYLIELPVFHYFYNLKTDATFKVNLISPYKFIKDIAIGKRENLFSIIANSIKLKDINTGWHFSYLFGFDIDLYQNKLKSFSHQEYNTAYFLNSKRLKACLSIRADILERNSVYKIIDIKKEFTPELYNALITAKVVKNHMYKSPKPGFYLSYYNIKYYLKFNIKPRLKLWLNKYVS